MHIVSHNSIDIDKTLFEQKLKEGLTNDELAKFFNCSKRTINYRKSKWGLSAPDKKIIIDKNDLILLSNKELQIKYSCSYTTLLKRKHELNIPIFDSNNSKKQLNNKLLNSNKPCPYCGKKFENWLSVRKHTSNCKLNNHEYFIDKIYGPYHYSFFCKFTNQQLKLISFSTTLHSISQSFKSRNIDIGNRAHFWNKENFKKAILEFYNIYKRTPSSRDTYNQQYFLPSDHWVKYTFHSWNDGIKFCGLEPNKTLGQPTEALDGKIYRSILEANFVNKFLFDKYNYVVEPLYPSPYNYIYDFYIKELNLYVEVFGLQGWKDYDLKTIQKIEINNNLEINFLPVYLKDIQKFNTLQDIVENNLKNNLTITTKM